MSPLRRVLAWEPDFHLSPRSRPVWAARLECGHTVPHWGPKPLRGSEKPWERRAGELPVSKRCPKCAGTEPLFSPAVLERVHALDCDLGDDCTCSAGEESEQ